ncbi:hypothetical protein SNE40_016148 [Patella caerulea]|uniref:Folate receptor-like domain-containing protein n=1 Tax=Patella caerulea TaxID=87958 RepID=A0AAN8P7Q8_PATCE
MGLDRNRTTLANTCLVGRHYKSEPTPEPTLFKHCKPWKDRSCCTGNTSEAIHTSDVWLHLSWNHCGNMSAKCLQQFHRETCFYQCSPNLGPWKTLIETSSFGNERYRNVPLCETDCSNWWNACKDDLTCVPNWGTGMDFTDNGYVCPTESTCKPFTEIYGNSTNFCEVVWDNSYKVVSDREPCMHYWFAEGSDNPNDKITLMKLGINQTTTISTNIAILILVFCMNFM